MKYNFVHCHDPADPNRCQGLLRRGQCNFMAVPSTKFCPRHGANSVLNAQEKVRVSNYRLQIWQERLEEFSESSQVKSLRDEIGILRITLETMVVKCLDATQLIIYSSKISELVGKIEKLVSSADRLERNMGMLLDKSAALNFAGQIVAIISKHVSDVEIIDQISGDIITALGSLTRSSE